jgi:hypothetical protein
MPHRHRRGPPASVAGAALASSLLAFAACDRDQDVCADDRVVTLERLEACERACADGSEAACDLRHEVLAGLSQKCHRRNAKQACKVLCEGRQKDARACAKFRQLSIHD